MMYGMFVNKDTVLVTSKESGGKPIVETEQPSIPQGYTANPKWVDYSNKIMQLWSIDPVEGSPESAALALSRLQFMSLPDEAAYEFRALANEWISGETYYGPNDESGAVQSRVLFESKLYKCLQTHVAQGDWIPTAASSLWAEILPGQEGNTPESGYAEWVQPDSTNPYSTGDMVIHNGHLWESTADGNVWEPGAVGAPWTDRGEYSNS